MGSFLDPITLRVNHFFLFKNTLANKCLLLKLAIFSACFLIALSFAINAFKNKAKEDLPVPYGPVKVNPD